MAIELDTTHVRAGDFVNGSIVDDDGDPRSVDVWLERRESNGTVTLPVTGVPYGRTTSDSATGRFQIQVPDDALPTQKAKRVGITWVVVTRGKAAALVGEQSAPIEIDNSHPPGPSPEILATAGGRPPRLRSLIGEHVLSIFMGLSFFAMFAAFGLYALMADVENPPPTALPIGALVVSIVPLAAAFLALRTVWPRTPRSPDLVVEPTVVRPGDRVTVRHVGGRLRPVVFLGVESYMGIYTSGIPSAGGLVTGANRRSFEARGGRVTAGQFETFEAYQHQLRFDDSGVATFEVPIDAAPSFSGAKTQLRWVVRIGGRKILRWGPISLREWHVVVVDPRVELPATTGS